MWVFLLGFVVGVVSMGVLGYLGTVYAVGKGLNW